VSLVGLGSEEGDRPSRRVGPEKEPPQAQESAKGKPVEVGKNVFLEVLPNGKRRVLISAYICQWQGQLEELLTRSPGGKTHESVLTAEIDARKVHEALILANATPGSPVQFDPKFRPPTGTTIKVSLRYRVHNKEVVVPAQSWIRNTKTLKELDTDWVFAGSQLVENPLDPQGQKMYLANSGDVICVINMPDALLDLPIRSDQSNPNLGGRDYEVWTERLPPKPKKEDEKSVVVVILEPVLKK
jgi:hypothetical protein